MKQRSGYPKRTNGLVVALVGAHAAGLLYVVGAKTVLGTIGISTPMHGVILGISVVVTLWGGWSALRFLDQEPEINFSEDERIA